MEAAPFTTLAINGTCFVDSFGNGPQFVLSLPVPKQTKYEMVKLTSSESKGLVTLGLRLAPDHL